MNILNDVINDHFAPKFSVGDRVIYIPVIHSRNKGEVGTVTSINGRFVFVRYGADVNSKATRAMDLILESGG